MKDKDQEAFDQFDLIGKRREQEQASYKISKKVAQQIVAISAVQELSYSEFKKALEIAEQLGASQSKLHC